MTNFEVVDAKPYHVGQMIRRMAATERNALVALGISPHRDLRAIFDASSRRRAWLIDGKLAGLGGVTGMLTSSSGFLWLVLAEDARRYPVAIVKEGRRELAKILDTHNELTTKIIAVDHVARRFARAMGFRAFGLPVKGMQQMALGTRAQILVKVARPSPPFFVFGLPRSRTAWLAEFLSHDGGECRHDAMVETSRVEDLDRFLAEPGTGLCETGLAMAWPVLCRRYPGARVVVVRRPVDEVRESLAPHGWVFEAGHLEWLNERLADISAMPGTLTIDFDDLEHEDACRAVFEHCLGKPFDRDWWETMSGRNIQIDMAGRLRRLTERAPAIQALVDQIEDLKKPVTIQAEPWESFLPDAKELIRVHRAEVGVADDLPFDPNYDLAEMIDSAGRLLVMTARAGRQLVGYLIFVIEESLENRGVVCGTQGPIYVRPEFRGVGPRLTGIGPQLHGAAVKELRNRGVDQLFMRAGVKGSGPKLGALYERMGAKDIGRMYALWIGDR